MRSARAIRSTLFLSLMAALATLLVACGSSGDDTASAAAPTPTPTPTPTPDPTPVSGVETPSSVAVVTATNAN